MPAAEPNQEPRAELVRLSFANPQQVDVLARLKALGASLEAGEVTREEHVTKRAELRASLFETR
jgi:hypothetical protein